MKPRFITTSLISAVVAAGFPALAADSISPSAKPDLVFDEVDGIVSVEAEHFYKQTFTDKRAWHITSSDFSPDLKPDADPAHLADASGGAYLEALPDSRATHDDTLIDGENFTDKCGTVAVTHYKVNIKTPGRYYIWIRSYSTGTEDNGVHVGLDGAWPESGQRWQTIEKNSWAWECKQRTPTVHTGVPMQSFLDIDKAGEHEIMLSLREDGFEIDKFILASNRDFTPDGKGSPVIAKLGTVPVAFKDVALEAVVKPEPEPQVLSLVQPRQPDGKGEIAISGELKQWHKVTLTLDGPFAAEKDTALNPFTDLAFSVTFTHESGTPSYTIPGYFAADGHADQSSADVGTQWRAHLSPDKTGTWNYTVSFTKGKLAALDGGGEAIPTYNGKSGTFKIAANDKSGRDFRAHGRLNYIGKHYLQFAGSKEYFLKVGPDSPENLLGYDEIDGTETAKKGGSLKQWKAHLQDWKAGDPTWKDGKGKGVIGALNYLVSKGCNSFSYLTYNAGGDGDDVWPFISRNEKFHYDCSKLDQWGIIFDHATTHGIYCHFKLQETENDDNRGAGKDKGKLIPTSLDGGLLGPERKLYLREIIARYGHILALNWNLGEENTQSTEEQIAMANYIAKMDAYQHVRVLHTYPGQQKKVYTPLLGDLSALTGVSLQIMYNKAHEETLDWVVKSDAAKKPWVVSQDEQGPAGLGAPPDNGYEGFGGNAHDEKAEGGSAAEGFVKASGYTLDDVRKCTLWGTFMAGGAGVEYYFGYKLPQNDLQCQDYRSRDKSWDYCRFAIEFFHQNKIPFQEMKNANALIGNVKNDNSKYCFAKEGELYLVYLPNGGETEIDLSSAKGDFKLSWFNPRTGGALVDGGKKLQAGSKVQLNAPDSQDWLAVIREK